MEKYGEIRLLALKGAQVVYDEKGDPAAVNIPIRWNDCNVVYNRDLDVIGVNLKVDVSDYNQAYKDACRSRAVSEGRDMNKYRDPSSEIQLHYSKEFREKAKAAAVKRLTAEHPEWQGQDPDDYKTDLGNAVQKSLRVRIATLYDSDYQRQQSAQQQTAVPAAAPVSRVIYDDDELPF